MSDSTIMLMAWLVLALPLCSCLQAQEPEQLYPLTGNAILLTFDCGWVFGVTNNVKKLLVEATSQAELSRLAKTLHEILRIESRWRCKDVYHQMQLLRDATPSAPQLPRTEPQ